MFERFVSFGSYGQWIAALLATFSVLVSGSMIAWPSGAFPKMADGSLGFDFSEGEKSLLVSLPFIGAIASPVPSGYLINFIGRKRAINFAVILVLFHWIVVGTSSNIYLLCFARFCGGLYCGCEYITVSIFVAEIVEARIRGSLISLTGMMFYSGALYVSFVSYLDYGTMTILCSVPALVLFVTYLFIPESPYYYLLHGRRHEAEQSLKWLRGECDPAEINRMEDGVMEQLKNKTSFKEIFTFKPTRNAFILIELFKFFAAWTTCNLLFAYCTQLIPNSWITSQDSYVVLCILWVLASLTSSFIMDRYPRRTILFISCISVIIFYGITAIWYYLNEFTDVDLSNLRWIPLVTVMGGSFFEVVGVTNIPNVLKGEMFPINVKTKACALSCMTACFFATLNSLFFYDLNNLIGQYNNFLKPIITSCICLYITIFHMFETKGLDLETIQNLLVNRNKTKLNDINCKASDKPLE